MHYPNGVPDGIRAKIEHELKLIAELDYARYFLTVFDLVRYARTRDILCQGRGSAANSAVCFCLGVTSVAQIQGFGTYGFPEAHAASFALLVYVSC